MAKRVSRDGSRQFWSQVDLTGKDLSSEEEVKKSAGEIRNNGSVIAVIFSSNKIDSNTKVCVGEKPRPNGEAIKVEEHASLYLMQVLVGSSSLESIVYRNNTLTRGAIDFLCANKNKFPNLCKLDFSDSGLGVKSFNQLLDVFPDVFLVIDNNLVANGVNEELTVKLMRSRIAYAISETKKSKVPAMLDLSNLGVTDQLLELLQPYLGRDAENKNKFSRIDLSNNSITDVSLLSMYMVGENTVGSIDLSNNRIIKGCETLLNACSENPKPCHVSLAGNKEVEELAGKLSRVAEGKVGASLAERLVRVSGAKPSSDTFTPARPDRKAVENRGRNRRGEKNPSDLGRGSFSATEGVELRRSVSMFFADPDPTVPTVVASAPVTPRVDDANSADTDTSLQFA